MRHDKPPHDLPGLFAEQMLTKNIARPTLRTMDIYRHIQPVPKALQD